MYLQKHLKNLSTSAAQWHQDFAAKIRFRLKKKIINPKALVAASVRLMGRVSEGQCSSVGGFCEIPAPHVVCLIRRLEALGK